MTDKGDLRSYIYPQEESGFPEVTETIVLQNEYAEETIYPSDKKVHIMHTEARIGCDAALLLTIEDNRTEHVVVTHYDPFQTEDHLKIIHEKIESHPKGKRFSMLLTRSNEKDDGMNQLRKALEEYSSNPPEVVSLPRRS